MVTTVLGRALYASLALIWPRLRADAHLPRQIPLSPQVYSRMVHALVRIPRLLARIDDLARRWQQGTLPAPRAPRTPTPDRTTSPAPMRDASPAPRRDASPAPMREPSSPTRMRDPSVHGWLARIHLPARQLAGQIEHLLAQEHSREFAAAAPQAGRLLRPLCRMFGVTLPDWLKLPPRRRKPRPARSPRRPAHPRPPSLTDPSLRLQPYVIAVARAWRPKNG